MQRDLSKYNPVFKFLLANEIALNNCKAVKLALLKVQILGSQDSSFKLCIPLQNGVSIHFKRMGTEWGMCIVIY